jgi:Icc-related predicted phosphoesterase
MALGMQILAVSDQEVPRLFTLVANGYFKDVDMLLGCGDLPYTYLEYLVTMLNVPLFYVPGNHDPQYLPRASLTYAEGGTNLDMRVTFVNGLLLAGLGGSVRYRPDGVNQYSQSQAISRAIGLLFTFWFNRLRYRRGLDILIAHSPPFKIHDDDSVAHQGLKALNLMIRAARPRFLFHGHTHFFRQNLADSVTHVGRTVVMNIFPYKLIEVPDAVG